MAESTDLRIQLARVDVEEALERLSRHFTDDCRLTFVMRKPGSDETYMIVSDEEDLAGLIETLERDRAKGGEADG